MTATLVPSRCSFARRHMLDTGELMWTPMSRVGTRGIRSQAGAVENMRPLGLIRPRDLVPSPSRRRAARCWPSVGLRGGQLAVSSQVPWIVRGRLPLRGHRGPGPVRASVHLSRVLVEASHTCRTPPRPAPIATPRHYLHGALQDSVLAGEPEHDRGLQITAPLQKTKMPLEIQKLSPATDKGP